MYLVNLSTNCLAFNKFFLAGCVHNNISKFPRSLLESGATVEQGLSAGVSAAAEAHRATMLAGADRLGRNIESVEQIRDAIMSLAREEDRVSLIEQLSDAVGFLKEGYKELEAKGTRFSQSLADR